MKREAIIKVIHIGKSFVEGGKEFQVIKEIDFDLFENEFVSIVGPSDSGKSTLLRIIAGIDKSTRGEVMYRGQKTNELNPNVAMVFQTFALIPWLTVLDNICLALEAKNIPRTEQLRRAEKYIDKVGLEGFEEAYPRELSRGIKQRVGLARALVLEPEVLLMDEPFSNLDVLSAQNLREEILDLWQDKSLPLKSILMVTNSIEEAVYSSDRVIVVSESPGKVIKIVKIDLPRPRKRKDKKLLELTDEIYTVLM